MVTAVIPAYNCADTVGEVVRGIKKYVRKVIVVDDGSRDATVLAARKAGAVVLRHDRNRGKAAAIATGVVRVNDDLLLIDADLQHLPSDAPQILERLRHSDIVLGSRFLGDYRGMPPHRILSNRITTFLTRLFTGYRITDSQCGFRALRRTAVRSLSWKGQSYDIEVRMLLEARRLGLKVSEVPIRTVYDHQESHIDNARHVLSLINIFFRELFR